MHFHWNGSEVLLSSKDHFGVVGYCNQISEVVPRWMSQIEESYDGDTDIQDIITAITVDKGGPQKYYLRQGF